MMKNLIIFLLLVVSNFLYAQEGYKIMVNITNTDDTSMMLAYYFGNKIKVEKKIKTGNSGKYVFEGDKKLPGGVYMIVNGDQSKLFEFIVNDRQQFALSTSAPDYSTNMKVKKSEENKLFFRYLLFNESIYKSIKKLNDSLKGFDKGSSDYKNLISQRDSLGGILEVYKKEVIERNKGTFFSTLLKAMEEVKIPDSIQNSSNSLLPYLYYKKHYWDHFDLSDSRLLRTPLYDKKIKDYFKNLVALDPDSVINDINRVVKLAGPNKETVSYLVWYFTSEYQNPKYVGFDKVFVWLVDNYFKKMDIAFTTPSILESLESRANTLRPLLIGKEAPNLILMDTTGNYISFLKLKKDYLILLFWDYDCSVCKREINELKKVLNEDTKYDIAVFAINVNSDLEKWKKTIKSKGIDHWVNVNGTRSVTSDFHDIYDIGSTPVIFLLDKDKKIIGKNIAADKIIDYIDLYNTKK
jgi:peroxiredoxin